MGFVKEFKEFAMKGNVMDMAVGVIIGGAFGKIVTSLVNDVLMPVVSLCTGGVDFTNLFVKLSGEGDFNTLAEAQEAGASVMAYGQFIQNIVDFLIVAFCIFLMIKGMNKLNKKKEEEPAPAPEPPAPSKEETLLTEIRDLLKNK
ncbi:MAG: large conductance mechanosensitive channel protein MscL [Bacteroidaceae bacterium]|jgi:large conductance mechanosensitive channel|nr:large conductance mechanosensitive channel protein MscL [Bacteroidaceae bacterium]MBP3833835.1 large conductance mechanosensitive channel protein MscL [Bacteroidaceae bacterium]MBQ8484525.1 large conductance mechanosensitive channel protein MscL [Bacteroidaceae bacterium]MBQ9675308.1 large conductance mechanosensitive channel protein MscL [Bacteroidaceae bacterium]